MNIMRNLLLASSTALALCVSTRSAGADVVYVSQIRTASASAMGGAGGGLASAPDYLEFSQSFTATNMSGWGNGASASHHSTLSPMRMDAGGGQSAWGGIQHSWGESSSVFDVTFAVDKPMKYVLYGYWEASPTSYSLADAGVEFIGPQGTIYTTHSYRNDTSNIYEDNYDLSGTLEPGVYRLKTYGSGRASAGAFDGCSSGFQATFLVSPSDAQSCGGEWIQSDPPSAIGVNGPVNGFALLPPSYANGPPRIVAGGAFSVAGIVAADNIAVFDPSTIQWSPLGGGTNGGVVALLRLPNGDLVAGGDFTVAGGAAANHIARWNGTTWTAIGAGMDGRVSSLVMMSNGDLVAGGSFGTAGGVAASNVARWNGSVWTALGTGIDGGNVLALAVLPNGDLVAGGDFFFIDGEQILVGIARWNGAVWSHAEGLSDPVFALAVLPNGDLAAGGLLSNVMRWNGSNWSPIGPGQSYVRTLEVMPNGDLVAGGFLQFQGDGSLSPVSRWNGSAWSTLGLMNSEIFALTALPDGQLFAGGAFTTINGVPFEHVAEWSGSWSPLNTPFGLNGPVLALAALPSGDIVAGGDFSWSGLSNMNAVTLWNGTTFAPMGQGLSDEVRALAVLPNGDVLAGGAFTDTAHGSASRLALWDGVDWGPFGSGNFFNGPVSALAILPNGDVIAAGVFTTIGAMSANRIARWNGTAWSPLGDGLMMGNVNALAVLPNGDLVAAGGFSVAPGVLDAFIARWNGSEWSPLGRGMNGFVRSLAVLPNGDLVAGGEFYVAGNVFTFQIARWDGVRWSAMGTGMDGTRPISVNSLTVWPNGDLVAGGAFRTAGGAITSNIARWNGTGWSSLGTGTNNAVFALAVLPSGDLVAGGSFTAAGGLPSTSIARYTFAAAGIGITQQPVSVAACRAGSATFVVGAGPANPGDLEFRWQVESAPQGSGAWNDLTDGPLPGITGSVASAIGTDTDTLTILDADAMAVLRYRVLVENTCGGSTSSITSDSALLHVCIGDYNCDGGIDGSDVQAFFAEWEIGAAGADLNSDGQWQPAEPRATTDQDGYYRLDVPDTYLSTSLVYALPAYFQPADGQATMRRVDLRHGAASGVDLALSLTQTIVRGSVFVTGDRIVDGLSDTLGQPVSGLGVVLTGPDGTVRRVTTNNRGQYELPVEGVGEYILSLDLDNAEFLGFRLGEVSGIPTTRRVVIPTALPEIQVQDPLRVDSIGVVDHAGADGVGSLASLFYLSNEGYLSTITFDEKLRGATIDIAAPTATAPLAYYLWDGRTLEWTLVPPVDPQESWYGDSAFILNEDLRLDGGDLGITLREGGENTTNRQEGFRAFHVLPGVEFWLENITLEGFTAKGQAGMTGDFSQGAGGGGAGLGGAILNRGRTILNHVQLLDNCAVGGNGGNVTVPGFLIQPENPGLGGTPLGENGTSTQGGSGGG
ncbi:MAG: hypothetical protein NTV94_09075, partial [Planctomycetota bacterium]|nr:hypothetical protein [Planctomycetota bacterium]